MNPERVTFVEETTAKEILEKTDINANKHNLSLCKDKIFKSLTLDELREFSNKKQ